MSKELMRFFGAIIILTFIGGSYLFDKSMEAKVEELRKFSETSQRLDFQDKDKYYQDYRDAEAQHIQVRKLSYGFAVLGSVVGLYFLIVAPGGNGTQANPAPKPVETLTPEEFAEEATYMVVWTTGKNASDPTIHDNYESCLTLKEANEKFEEIAARKETYIASIVAVVKSTDYEPNSKHA